MGQLFLGATLVVLLLAGGYSMPNFDFDDEIETFGPFARTEGSVDSGDGLGEAVISSSADDADSNAFYPPIFPPYNSPFFANPMFASFGNIDFGFGNAVPWWKGRHVCADRVEGEDIAEEDDEDDKATSVYVKPQHIFGGFQFSVNSCVEKPHKHTCKQIYSHNGQKKTLTITRQCCQGFARPQNAEYTDQCERIDVKDFLEAAKDMPANGFIREYGQENLKKLFETNITLFMPTDSAFDEYSNRMLESNLVGSRRRRSALVENSFASSDLGKNHIVKGLINTDDMANDDILQTDLNNRTIRINIFNRPSKGAVMTANCAKIESSNNVVTNGIVHTVGKVLTEVTDNLMDIIRKRSDMAVFRTVLEKTKLSSLLEGKKPVTVFAPTDRAFEKLDMNLRRKLKEGKGCAANILKNHILDFTFCGVAFTGSKPVAYNILGESLRFEPTSKSLDFNAGLEDVLINGQAIVTESDVMGTNGVLHVVDAVLPSDSSRSISSLMEQKNLTVFKSLVEAAGLESEFNDYDNVTIFAPVDKSYEGSSWAKKLKDNAEQLRNSEELKSYLRAHVIQPKIKTCDLKEDVIKSVAGSELRINLYSTHSIFTNVMNRATVNCARLVHFDDESCGSVLHQVERDLENPKDNLFEMLENEPSYSKFLDVVKAANLTDLLKNESDSFTIFLPKNDVFREFDIDVASNQSEAESFVKDHIVNDIVCCAGITPTNWPFVRTIEAISGSDLRINRDRRPKVENAMITSCDGLATNGIVHEINDVIITKKKQALVIPNKSKYDILRDVFF